MARWEPVFLVGPGVTPEPSPHLNREGLRFPRRRDKAQPLGSSCSEIGLAALEAARLRGWTSKNRGCALSVDALVSPRCHRRWPPCVVQKGPLRATGWTLHRGRRGCRGHAAGPGSPSSAQVTHCSCPQVAEARAAPLAGHGWAEPTTPAAPTPASHTAWLRAPSSQAREGAWQRQRLQPQLSREKAETKPFSFFTFKNYNWEVKT